MPCFAVLENGNAALGGQSGEIHTGKARLITRLFVSVSSQRGTLQNRRLTKSSTQTARLLAPRGPSSAARAQPGAAEGDTQPTRRRRRRPVGYHSGGSRGRLSVFRLRGSALSPPAVRGSLLADPTPPRRDLPWPRGRARATEAAAGHETAGAAGAGAAETRRAGGNTFQRRQAAVQSAQHLLKPRPSLANPRPTLRGASSQARRAADQGTAWPSALPRTAAISEW